MNGLELMDMVVKEASDDSDSQGLASLGLEEGDQITSPTGQKFVIVHDGGDLVKVQPLKKGESPIDLSIDEVSSYKKEGSVQNVFKKLESLTQKAVQLGEEGSDTSAFDSSVADMFNSDREELMMKGGLSPDEANVALAKVPSWDDLAAYPAIKADILGWVVTEHFTSDVVDQAMNWIERNEDHGKWKSECAVLTQKFNPEGETDVAAVFADPEQVAIDEGLDDKFPDYHDGDPKDPRDPDNLDETDPMSKPIKESSVKSVFKKLESLIKKASGITCPFCGDVAKEVRRSREELLENPPLNVDGSPMSPEQIENGFDWDDADAMAEEGEPGRSTVYSCPACVSYSSDWVIDEMYEKGLLNDDGGPKNSPDEERP